jgi:hypothetical protein
VSLPDALVVCLCLTQIQNTSYAEKSYGALLRDMALGFDKQGDEVRHLVLTLYLQLKSDAGLYLPLKAHVGLRHNMKTKLPSAAPCLRC